jgi:UDP-MurNAc hydroxylase
MKVTFYVNAMVLLESNETKVLCDPWITFGNNSDSIYYNFPENPFSKKDIENLKPDYIYISHSHPDHYDPKTLNCFSKKTPVIIAKFKYDFLRRNLQAIGFENIIISDPIKGLPLNNKDHCWIIPAAETPELDSVATFRLGSKSAVNLNDNILNIEQSNLLKKQLGNVDLALIPYTGYGPYPMCYDNLKDDEKARAALEKKISKYDEFITQISLLQPDFVLPFGGGVALGSYNVKRLKYSGMGIPDEAVRIAKNDLDFEGLLLSPGSCYDINSRELKKGYPQPTEKQNELYLEALEKKPDFFEQGGKFYIEESQQKDVIRLLQTARQKQKKWQDMKEIVSEKVFFIDIKKNYLYRFSLANVEVSKVQHDAIKDEAYEIFRMPYSLLIGLLTGLYKISDVEDSHISYFRKPNTYDPDLHNLMNHLHL